MTEKTQINKGDQFFRLTAIRRVRNDKKSQQRWLFRCQCGKETVGSVYVVRQGRKQSCGCLRDEHSIINGHKNKIHGHAVARVGAYESWKAMRRRCNSREHHAWRHYGGRGITICKRWEKFENFLADMGERPTPKHSIDRINNDGNYEPSNCRWATITEQNKNKRRSQGMADWRVIEQGRGRYIVLETRTIQYGPFRRMDELEKFLKERRALVLEDKC